MCSSGICRRLGSDPFKDGGSPRNLKLAACELNLDCTCFVLFGGGSQCYVLIELSTNALRFGLYSQIVP